MQNIIDGVRKWALKRDRYEKKNNHTRYYIYPFNKSLAAKQMKSNEKKKNRRKKCANKKVII